MDVPGEIGLVERLGVCKWCQIKTTRASVSLKNHKVVLVSFRTMDLATSLSTERVSPFIFQFVRSFCMLCRLMLINVNITHLSIP